MTRIAAVDFDPTYSRNTFASQVAARIDFVVAQVTTSHAGSPANEIADLLVSRLRRMGVSASLRQVEPYARLIARLPEAPPPPRKTA
jgi:hypothetical protein